MPISQSHLRHQHARCIVLTFGVGVQGPLGTSYLLGLVSTLPGLDRLLGQPRPFLSAALAHHLLLVLPPLLLQRVHGVSEGLTHISALCSENTRKIYASVNRRPFFLTLMQNSVGHFCTAVR